MIWERRNGKNLKDEAVIFQDETTKVGTLPTRDGKP